MNNYLHQAEDIQTQTLRPESAKIKHYKCTELPSPLGYLLNTLLAQAIGFDSSSPKDFKPWSRKVTECSSHVSFNHHNSLRVSFHFKNKKTDPDKKVLKMDGADGCIIMCHKTNQYQSLAMSLDQVLVSSFVKWAFVKIRWNNGWTYGLSADMYLVNRNFPLKVR